MARHGGLRQRVGPWERKWEPSAEAAAGGWITFSYLTGDESQICRLGVCLLITKVPFVPSFTVSTPCCGLRGQACRRESLLSRGHVRAPPKQTPCASASVIGTPVLSAPVPPAAHAAAASPCSATVSLWGWCRVNPVPPNFAQHILLSPDAYRVLHIAAVHVALLHVGLGVAGMNAALENNKEASNEGHSEAKGGGHYRRVLAEAHG